MIISLYSKINEIKLVWISLRPRIFDKSIGLNSIIVDLNRTPFSWLIVKNSTG